MDEKERILEAVAAAYRAAKNITFTDKQYEREQQQSTILYRLLGSIEGIFGVEICSRCGQEITGKYCPCDTEAEMKYRLQQDHDREMLDEWKREQAEDAESRFDSCAEYGVSEKDFF